MTAKRQPTRQLRDEEMDLTAQQAEALRDKAREMRAPAREMRDLAPGEVLGRNGEVLSLKRSADMNIFDIPPQLNSDPNWTREWKRFEVYNKPDQTHQQHLAENGWRPVLIEEGNGWGEYYAGRNGEAVRREDMILMERPRQLTQQVQELDRRRADQQMRVNTQRFANRSALETTTNAFSTSNPNVPSSVKTGYEAGPAAAKHQTIPD
jgi:hypothetical protein